MSHRLRVFAWHNVEGSWCFPSRPGQGARGIERQLRFLRRVTRVMPLTEAVAALRDGRDLPPRATAITFDDGYRDNLELAVPLLEKLGLPATFFLVPGLLSGSMQPWWETLGWAFAKARVTVLDWNGQHFPLQNGAQRWTSYQEVAEQLKRRDRLARDRAVQELTEILAPTGSPGHLFLEWDGARQLVERGFTIGSHTMYHAILTEESPEDRRRDLARSKERLENELGVPIELLAYPNGTVSDYDADVISAAQWAGYSGAFTLLKRPNTPETPPYELGRFLMYPQKGVSNYANVLPPAVRAYRAVKGISRRPVRGIEGPSDLSLPLRMRLPWRRLSE